MKRKYVLFGTGDYYKRYIHWFKKEDVVALMDNDRQKQGQKLDGYPVISPQEIQNISYDSIVILSFYFLEMKTQLIRLGVADNKIFHFYDLHRLLSENDMNMRGCHVLLLSHDLIYGGPALALYHSAITLRKSEFDVTFASMIDGPLREKLIAENIPVVIDQRLQIYTMTELPWTQRYDLLICNTINYHIFLSDRNEMVPVIWWLHDSSFFYDGINSKTLEGLGSKNLKYLSVGPVPGKAMRQYQPDIVIDDLIYGVSDEI